MIIGVAGPNGAGKGAVIETLASHGFTVHSLSDVIRQVLAERGVSETRDRMIEVGRELRREGGTAVLADTLAQQLSPGTDHAIDSIRHPAEVQALRAVHPDFWLIWVEAPIDVRFARMQERGRPGDPENLDAMRTFEERERHSADEAGQQLDAVEALLDERLDNSGSRGALSAAVSACLKARR
ncbi:MAG: hypothetical protein CBC48_10980 [bacterium TMED88]|nr:hypothetical protein [Deltaproteobacteria bacterium]OUV30054.1 MAG: hypothetical protein CBC48_10980 [bacterium TMED88]